MERSEAPYGSTASNSADIVAHNIWNSIMELLFHVQISAASSKSVEGIDLAGVAMSCHLSSVASLAQAISCSNVRGVVPVHEMFWFCLVQVSSTHSVVSQLFSWRVLMMGHTCSSLQCVVLQCVVLLRIMVAPNGSGPDFDGVGHRSIDA